MAADEDTGSRGWEAGGSPAQEKVWQEVTSWQKRGP